MHHGGSEAGVNIAGMAGFNAMHAQAYIFTMLSALYIGSAIEEHEH